MTERFTTFITYTKGAVQYVTIPAYESQFLDVLEKFGGAEGYKRQTHTSVCVGCSPKQVQKEATVLTLIKGSGE